MVVTGPLTRDEVARWQEDFADALVRGRGLRIDLAESGPWDLAGVQLLLAAIASGRRAGWPIVLARVPKTGRDPISSARIVWPARRSCHSRARGCRA